MASSRSSMVAFLQEKFNRYSVESKSPNQKTYRPLLSPLVLRIQCESFNLQSLLERNAEEQNALNFLLAQPIITWDYTGSYASYPIVFNLHDVSDRSWTSLPIHQQERSFRQYKLQLFNVLLEKFPNTLEGSRALHSALSHPDQNGQTALHLIIKDNFIDVLNILLPRIAIMTFSQKKELACMTNSAYQSIFHLGDCVNEKSFFDIITALGSDVMHEAVLVKDLQRNTIIHSICRTPKGADRFAKIKYFCDQLEPLVEPGEESKIESHRYLISEFNNQDSSPLHLCCKNPSDDAICDEKTIDLLCSAMGKDDFFRIAMHKDSEGCSALDWAIEKKSHAMVTGLFTPLSLERQQQIILQEDKKNHTALHYALRSGEKPLIENIIRKLTATQLFVLHSSLIAPLEAAALEGKVFALYQRLISELIPEFLLVEHLLKQAAYVRVVEQSILSKFSSLFSYFQKTAALPLKIADAQACFKSVEEKAEMPRQLLLLCDDVSYQAKRSNLLSANRARLQECAVYFTSTDGYKKYQMLGEDVINALFPSKQPVSTLGEYSPEPNSSPIFAPVYYVPATEGTLTVFKPAPNVVYQQPSAPDLSDEISALPLPPSRAPRLFNPKEEEPVVIREESKRVHYVEPA